MRPSRAQNHAQYQMRQLLLLLCLALSLTGCAMEKRFAEAPKSAKHAYEHRQRVNARLRKHP